MISVVTFPGFLLLPLSWEVLYFAEKWMKKIQFSLNFDQFWVRIESALTQFWSFWTQFWLILSWLSFDQFWLRFLQLFDWITGI